MVEIGDYVETITKRKGKVRSIISLNGKDIYVLLEDSQICYLCTLDLILEE